MPGFNANEEKFVRYLHGRYVKGESVVFCPDALAATALMPEEHRQIEARLVQLDVFELIVPIEGSKDYSYVVTGKICELVSELDHRPPVNYWQKFSEKWFSWRWSVPLTILFVLVPIIVQYATWAYNLYDLCKSKPANQMAPQSTSPAPQSTSPALPSTSPAPQAKPSGSSQSP